MTVSVVIPTHKRPGPAARLIESLKEQDFPKGDLQILLVSNLPDKRLEKLAMEWESQFESFKYLSAGSLGVNKARNLGLRFAGGDIVYFLDDDCALPRKSHLKELVREHARRPDAAGIGGGYLAPENLHGLETFYSGMAESWLRGGMAARGGSGPACQLPGGNCSYKREVFERGFAFDPGIVFGGSEESLNRLLRDSGRQLFFSEHLSVWHFPRVSFFALAKKAFLQGRGAFFSRLSSGEALKDLESMKKEGAFFAGKGFSAAAFFYGLFFKLGHFYGLSREKSAGRAAFRWLYFPALIIKSRLYFLREHVAVKYGARLWGRVFVRALGVLWFGLGWLWGRVFVRALGVLWFGLGWLWGRVFVRALGVLWFGLGWLWGRVFVRALGVLRFGLGWLWGRVFLRALGVLWFGLGWLWGRVFVRALGVLRFGLGWLWGRVFVRALGVLWFGLGWLWGRVFLRALGVLWFGLGWIYGRALIPAFHHSPPMKIFYFSKYQYYKRIRPELLKMAERRAVKLKAKNKKKLRN